MVLPNGSPNGSPFLLLEGQELFVPILTFGLIGCQSWFSFHLSGRIGTIRSYPFSWSISISALPLVGCCSVPLQKGTKLWSISISALPLVGLVWHGLSQLYKQLWKDRNYSFLSFLNLSSTFGRLLFSSSVERNHGIAGLWVLLVLVGLVYLWQVVVQFLCRKEPSSGLSQLWKDRNYSFLSLPLG